MNVGVELVCCLASFRRFKFLFRMLITKNYKNIYVKIKNPQVLDSFEPLKDNVVPP